jgi:Ni/Fe-hydrogenase 1 B-type cytochrome subunit
MTAPLHEKHIIEAEESRDVITLRVWQVPIRIIHWTVFLSTALLTVTGLYIGRPFIQVGSDPDFVMGWMRGLHQLGAWIFIAAILARIILMFTGNRYARWTEFIPVDRTRRKESLQVLKYYTFLRVKPVHYAGHNPMAGLTYAVVLVMFLVQTVTGFALRDLAAPSALFQVLGGWTFSFTDPQTIRFIHHLIMWMTWGFVVHHVYSATLMDWEERSGLVSSMISGRKRIPRERL